MGVRSLWSAAVAAILLSVALIRPVGAAQFQQIGSFAGSRGVAWGDYDGDGYPDLFIGGMNNSNYPLHGVLLYRNSHDLTFTEVGQSLGLPQDIIEHDGAAWADYDNDGDLDIMVSSPQRFPFLFRRDASSFVEIGDSAGFNQGGPSRHVAWCDYDHDGLLDVFVPINGQDSYLYHNNGNGTFTDVHVAAGILTGAPGGIGGMSAAWGDYDNDGQPDLLISRIRGPAMLFRNNGDGTFTDVSASAGVTVALDGYTAVWGDYDNDGWLDAYITRGEYLTNPPREGWLFHNNHDGTFTEVGAAAGVAGGPQAVQPAAWGDYDNDGWLDLYVGRNTTSPRLYHNNQDGTFTDVASGSGLEGSFVNTGVAWADIDLDGRLDLMQACDGEVSRLFHNIGSAGNWLRVRALTSGTGDATAAGVPTREAIGARVDLNLDNDASFPTTAHRTLVRLIGGGSGHAAQNELVAQFGLADAATVAVRVRFPDGSVVIHKDVAANQQIVIRDVPAGYVEIFTDVPLDYWSYPQVKAVEAAGIVKGYTDGTYKPTDPVTRDQMAVYISRALAGGDDKVPAFTGTPSFSDVDANNWALKYVQYAVSKAVVKGYSDGTYKPTDQVDRGQMSVFIARAIATPTDGADLVSYTPPATATFPDVATSFWAYKYVEYIAQPGVGVTKGYPDKLYHPEYVCTRDQMAVYVARAFKLAL